MKKFGGGLKKSRKVTAAIQQEQERERRDLEDQLELQAALSSKTFQTAAAAADLDLNDENENAEESETVYKGDLMLERAREMNLETIAGRKLKWIERLEITNDTGLQLQDVNNDLARELAFYQQASESARRGRLLVKQASLKFERPDDYFAEMVKSDDHMIKVKERLVEEADAVKKSEEAKKMRHMRKFGKQVQVERLLERQGAKKKMLDRVQELKRKRKNNPGEGLDDNEEFDIALEDAPAQRQKQQQNGSGGKRQSHGQQGKNAKRQMKDEKYGFGGKKKRSKSNTTESTDDFNFNWRANKKLPSGMRGAGKAKKAAKAAANARPGKSKRQKLRS